MRFYIVDVFSESKYAGNQLAVFRRAGSLTGIEMQAIAREMNFSETSFIRKDAETNGGFDVRIFTPKEELPFAGHPTLGTAFVILQEILKRPARKLVLNLQVGRIPVTATHRGGKLDLLWMQQKRPAFGEQVDAGVVASALSLSSADMDERFPVEEVSTGIPFIIVPLKSRDAIKRCRVNPEKYEELIKSRAAKGILVFCPEPYDERNDFNARMFAPDVGVMEDPATGSANGCLAAYLVKHRYLGGNEVNARVEQGFEIGRPSLLYLRARGTDGSVEVNVGGRVAMVAEGRFV